MIPFTEHLLPDTETPFNKALAAVSTRLDLINAPSRLIWNPYTTPEPFLKAMAHAFSVDLWKDSWHIDRKRRIIANAIEMHAAKGTLAGVIKYLEFADARLISYEKPPQKLFMGAELGKAEREVWLERLPQVRVWREPERSQASPRSFMGGPGASAFFEADRFTYPNTAVERLARRARYVVGGVETTIRVSDFGTGFRLHLRKAKPDIQFDGDFMDTGFMGANNAPERLFAVEARGVGETAWRQAAYPSLKLVQHEPVTIKIRQAKPVAVFFTSGLPNEANAHYNAKEFFMPSNAAMRLYQRYAINDGSSYARPPATFFTDEGRFGFPRHTVYLRISVPRVIPEVAAGEGFAIPKSRFWLPQDLSRVDFLRQALIAAKRHSDVVMLKTNWRPRIRAGRDLLIAGVDSFIVGKPTSEALYGT